MPTSASTGTKQVKSSGKSDKKDAPKAPKSGLNSPDGAPIKTNADDVKPGDRVDLAPTAPQDREAPVADHNNSGVIHAVTRKGAHVSVAVDDPDWVEKLRDADPKHPSLPKD